MHKLLTSIPAEIVQLKHYRGVGTRARRAGGSLKNLGGTINISWSFDGPKSAKIWKEQMPPSPKVPAALRGIFDPSQSKDTAT